MRGAAGTTGEAYDDFDIEHFGEEDGFTESVNIFFCDAGVGMDGVSVATQSGNVNAAVFKLFLPSLGLGTVSDEVVKGTMMIIGIAARADFHGLEAEGRNFVEHGVERELLVDRIEDADRNLAEIAGGPGREGGRRKGSGFGGVGDDRVARNAGGEQTAGGGEKSSAVH